VWSGVVTEYRNANSDSIAPDKTADTFRCPPRGASFWFFSYFSAIGWKSG
jgi:hypothetical protein